MGYTSKKRTVTTTAEVWTIKTPLDAAAFNQVVIHANQRTEDSDDYHDDAYEVTTDEGELVVTFRPTREETP